MIIYFKSIIVYNRLRNIDLEWIRGYTHLIKDFSLNSNTQRYKFLMEFAICTSYAIYL